MEILLFGALGLLVVFMFINTRRRTKMMKAEQEKKARETVPGARVLLQGGLYGTIVSFDPDDLDSPALVELAPGTVVEVHSQAVLRIVDSPLAEDEIEEPADETPVADLPEMRVETPEETRARLEQRESDDKK